MGKEQELLALLTAAEKWLMTSRLPGHEVAAINTATAIRDAREIIARHSSSDEQAEVVESIDKHAISVSHTCPDFIADPCGSAKCAGCGGSRRDHRASPSGVKAGVTELRAAAQAVIDQWDTPNWKLDVPTGTIINRLRAALGVGDEGMGEAAREDH